MLFPFVLLLAVASVQSPDPPAKDALALLTEVGQRYADAKSYHIEAIEENTSSNELQRFWHKTLLTAIVMPGGRYRYEGRSGNATAILVSDGTSQWDYHVYEHIYTQQPTPSEDAPTGWITGEAEGDLMSARQIVRQMIHRTDNLKSASFLPDETISVNGKSVPCYVIRYSSEDLQKKYKDDVNEWTLWIDKSRKVVLKTYSQGVTQMRTGSHTRIPLHMETTVIYPKVDLDPQEAASSFNFVPPSDAKLVAAFPGPSIHEVDLTGKPAPELQLKSIDGKITTLSSFHGQPVFIEFWATWCGPCVDLMPDLNKLYAELKGKGLGWMSIDNDEDSSDAATFLSGEHITWPNYHDEDGSLGKAFQRHGIPLGVLIDADGKIVFYQSGYEISDLRAAIAKLGPQFRPIVSPTTAAK